MRAYQVPCPYRTALPRGARPEGTRIPACITSHLKKLHVKFPSLVGNFCFAINSVHFSSTFLGRTVPSENTSPKRAI